MRASDGLANAVANYLATLFPAGAVLEFRSGPRPASIHDAPAGVLLAEKDIVDGDWTAAANRRVTDSDTWVATGVAGAGAGTDIGHARLRTAGDLGTANATDLRCDFTVGLVGSGADIEVDNVNVAVGQLVNIASFFLGA